MRVTKVTNLLPFLLPMVSAGEDLPSLPVFIIRPEVVYSGMHIQTRLFPRYRVGGPIMNHVNFKSFHSAMVVLLNFYILQG